MAGFSLLSCSAPSDFVGMAGNVPKLANLANQNGSDRGTGKSGNGAAVKSNDDEAELPAVDVTGSNLTADCLDLSTYGKMEDHRVVYCTLETKIERQFIFTADFKLKSKPQDEGYLPAAVSGRSAPEAKSWFLSRSSNLQLQFEIPYTELIELRKQPALLVMDNAAANKKPTGKPLLISTTVSDYFKPTAACANYAHEHVASLSFKEIKKDSSGVTFAAQQTLASDAAVPPSSVICEAEFLNDLTFSWPVLPDVSPARLAGIIGGRTGLFTDVKDVEKSFYLSRGSYLWRGTADKPALENAPAKPDGDSGTSQPWCVYGRTDCLSQTANAATNSVSQTIHLTRLARAPLALNAHALLNPPASTSGMEIKFFNQSGTVSPFSPVLQSGGNVKMRVRYIPPEPPSAGSLNLAEIKTTPAAVDCNSSDKLLKDTVRVIIPRNNPSVVAQRCPFGVGDNNIRETGDGYHTARIERNFNINIPAGRTVCSMKATGENPHITYDDHIVLTLNNNILIATGQPDSLTFQRLPNNFYQYSWAKLRGKRFGHRSFCADGAACVIPNTETAGALSFELSDAANKRLFESLKGLQLYFSMVLIGDNDLSSDCLQSQDLVLKVDYSYYAP